MLAVKREHPKQRWIFVFPNSKKKINKGSEQRMQCGVRKITLNTLILNKLRIKNAYRL